MAESAESKSGQIVPANAGRETDVIGELARTPIVPFEVPAIAPNNVPPMEVAETSSGDNNKRVEDARRARVAWLQKLRSECATEEEFQTARTQPTWTELDVTSSSSCLQDGSSPADLERMREENRLYFQDLLGEESNLLCSSGCKLLPEVDRFYIDLKGRLEAGQKIGGGGQADIHEAILDGQVKAKWVLKVFRSDCSLADLQRSWVKDIAKIADFFMPIRVLDRPYINCCAVIHGTLLESGRFAFVLERCWGDLRKAIDSQIVKDKTHVGPPFPIITSCELLRSLARGMRQLHREDICHRDLKAANCLLRYNPVDEGGRLWLKNCLVADFDSPNGVVGTGFWRAPEVLLALKNKGRDLHSNQEIWTKKVDVYSYAMTCYEVLTGCIPFEDRAPNDYDGVIGGERPPLPDYVNPRLQELIKICWHSEPSMRPEFQHIVWELFDFIKIEKR